MWRTVVSIVLLLVVLVVVVIALQACTWVIEDTRPPAEATATSEAVLAARATATAIVQEEADQQDCRIAGNINGAGDKIYHVPGGAYYNRVKIDLGAGEAWFCTAEEAAAAGYRAAAR